LYGGLDRAGIQRKKGLKKDENILDHMGSTELAANLFRATQTEDKLKKDKTKSKTEANKTHFEIGKKVRATIQEIGGTMPEDLDTAENIKHVEAKANKIELSNNYLCQVALAAFLAIAERFCSGCLPLRFRLLALLCD